MGRSVEEYFQDVFGSEPLARGEAPGRINLIGEHTDYNGGMVLPTSLQRSVKVAIDQHSGHEDLIYSPKYDAISKRQVGAVKSGDWSDYAIGAIAKARELGLIAGAVNLAITSTLPSGAGVSSSAALVTAVLRAAHNMAGFSAEPLALAHAARAVENDYIGVPCGIMDQMAVGLAAPGQALAINTSTAEYDVIDIPEDFIFVTLHTGIRRELNDGRYEQRFDECAAAKTYLGVKDLCLLDEERMDEVASMPALVQARVRHVISEHGRTRAARDALIGGDREGFGELMNQSHVSYSQEFQASTPKIDEITRSAQELGAIGARLTGGGFGGCIVALLSPQSVPQWTEVMARRHPDTWLV